MTYLTNKPFYVYCFSKKLSTDLERYRISIKVFEDSVKHLSKLYPYRIVTDKETVPDIGHLSKDIEVVDSSGFIFIDDFKLSLVGSLTDTEVIIDPDVLVYKELNSNLNLNAIFCHSDSPNDYWYQDYIPNFKGSLLFDRIKNAGKIPFVPNIGLLKINNPKLLSDYKFYYNLYREDLINRQYDHLSSASILLGQYLLGILLYEGNYSYFNYRDTNNTEQYVHLAGPQKFKLYKQNL